MARELDVPSFKVLNNSVLIDLVQNPPRNTKEMFHRKGISFRVARRYSSDIIKTIRDSKKQSTTPSPSPARNSRKTSDKDGKHRMEVLKNWRKLKAEELGLPVGVIFSANLLESLSDAPPSDLQELGKVPGMRQWRVAEFGEEILQALNAETLRTA
jgi:ribonuclease D